MALNEFHRKVAAVALGVAGARGFALGGGNALIAHGIVARPTEDVDIFTDDESAVQTAANEVEAALLAAGLAVEREDHSGGLAEIFPGMGDGLAEWNVAEPGGRQTVLQLAYFERSQDPVIMDVGPVLAIEDVLGGKVCALAGRFEARDYIDTAAALDRYSVTDLIGFARRLDSGLTDRDFADAGRRLDQLSDRTFGRYGLADADVVRLRDKFESWPR